jgi:hypothetical protein
MEDDVVNTFHTGLTQVHPYFEMGEVTMHYFWENVSSQVKPFMLGLHIIPLPIGGSNGST